MKIVKNKVFSKGSQTTESIKHGSEPFKRALLISSIILIFSLFISILSKYNVIFTVPGKYMTLENFLPWSIQSLFIPHAILYVIVIASIWWILSLQDIKYIIWLFRQSIRSILFSFLALESILIVLIYMSLYMYNPNSWVRVIESQNMTPVQNSVMTFSMISVIVPVWVGYRIAWSSYRELGAKTMQDRYEDYLTKLEIKDSGQFWDKVVIPLFNKLTGADGHKPRFGLIWIFFIGPAIVIITWSLYNVLEQNTILSTGIFGILPITIIFHAAILKWYDPLAKKRIPYLYCVRGPETVDEYDPESSGFRKFKRN